MPLFEIAILEHPTRKEAEDGASPKLIFGPKAVVAKDGQAAAIGVVLGSNGELAGVDTARLEVLVRPFA